ncbi:MAG: DUF2764 family protein [Candidatus Omnitrophica bacterium]|nr:DUF2764 family protein [Candidatus Omnitrophota bacterium]
MPSFYTYFISSLPMLRFGQPLPFSYAVFLGKCSELIPAEDFKILSSPEDSTRLPLVKEIKCFKEMLANELVKVRAASKKVNPEKYLRPDRYSGQSIYHIALAAHRNPSPLEAERYLDQERWNYLEEKSFGHYFDLEALIIYAHKLLILERWEKINSAPSHSLLEEAIRQG